MSTVIRDTFLKVLNTKTHSTMGLGIPIQEIAEEIITSLGEVDTPALRNKISWLASQDLQKNGLITPVKRGVWALTAEGLKPFVTTTLFVETQQNTEENPSQWLDDSAGLPFNISFGSTQEVDPYLLSLQVGKTKCFSNFDAENTVCGSCAIRKPCLEKWLESLRKFRDDIQRQENMGKVNEPPKQMEGEDLDAVLDDLTKPKPTTQNTPTTVWRDLFAQVESICSVCRQIIPAGTMAKYKPGDFRHVGCV